MVPLQLLIGMFSDGVNSLKELANQRKARASDLSGNTGARRVREKEIERNNVFSFKMCEFLFLFFKFTKKCHFFVFIPNDIFCCVMKPHFRGGSAHFFALPASIHRDVLYVAIVTARA